PARRRSRALTSASSGDGSMSNRSSTAVATLFTFWPPGPDARTNRSESNPSSIESEGVMGRGIVAGLLQEMARGPTPAPDHDCISKPSPLALRARIRAVPTGARRPKPEARSPKPLFRVIFLQRLHRQAFVADGLDGAHS